MGQPAAKENDKITGLDKHTLPGPPPQVVFLPFVGELKLGLSQTVKIMGKAAAVEGSMAKNQTVHPTGSNLGTITAGSKTVLINGKAAARNGDPASTCDEAGTPGKVVAAGTVQIGD
jgi:uncharacterized Zn-binding protein involved in type VI secretion